MGNEMTNSIEKAERAMKRREIFDRLSVGAEERMTPILSEAIDEIASRDAEVAELREELTRARFHNTVVYGTSHPEIYKTNEDFLQEHVKLLRDAVAKAAAHVKPTCNDLYEELMQSLSAT
jgi:nitrogen-specific signal transduction histidine kinase